jgi:hypothetical protein
MRTNDLVKFIKEREKVRVAKEAGKQQPWTKDSILASYRFCNVRREDDRVTRWLRREYYQAFEMDKEIWFAAVVARLFNQPDALQAIAPYIVPWKPEKVRQILHKRRDAGLRNFNAAYIVSTNGVAMDKVDYIVTRVLGPLWAARKALNIPLDGTLRTLYEQLTQFDGLGSFIAAQVVADLKYMRPYNKAPDWWTFAAPGPGSRRGLNRVNQFPTGLMLPEKGWLAHLTDMLERVNKKLPEPLHAQDLQNCLCEFDKYERARLGEGRPKQLYKEREA